MKTLIIIVYLSIGFGVTAAYGERHHKVDPTGLMPLLAVATIWPGMIAADVYRASFPEIKGACNG